MNTSRMCLIFSLNEFPALIWLWTIYGDYAEERGWGGKKQPQPSVFSGGNVAESGGSVNSEWESPKCKANSVIYLPCEPQVRRFTFWSLSKLIYKMRKIPFSACYWKTLWDDQIKITLTPRKHLEITQSREDKTIYEVMMLILCRRAVGFRSLSWTLQDSLKEEMGGKEW